jgi:flagellar hook-length control protein FliK
VAATAASQAALSSADVDADAATTAAPGAGGSGRGSARADATTVDKGSAATGDSATDAKTLATAFAVTLADAKTSNAPSGAGERSTHDLASAIAATGGAAAPAPSNGATGPVSASATVATPVDAPDFAAAFGLQVSVLAKDGVQQAQLHLNPADMGPVSIHITLDGTLARVDFGADVAATRHAIEAGLPELASALRDAGFTLAGGGVAQHSASNGGGAGDDAQQARTAIASAPASRAAVGALDASARRQAQRSAAGGIDLFA